MIGLQMLLDRGERLEWFASAEIWVEAIASVLGFYLFIVHVMTTKVHFLRKALFKDRNLVLSTMISFAARLRPAADPGFDVADAGGIAQLSGRHHRLHDHSARRGAGGSAGADEPGSGTSRLPAVHIRRNGAGGLCQLADAWLFAGDGLAAGGRGGPASGCRSRHVASGARQGGVRHARSEASARKAPRCSTCRALYGSTIGIAVVQIFFYNNTQAMHLALAKNLTPYRAAAHVAGSIAKPSLAALNGMITQQAAVVAVIDQFKILMFAMLIVSPLVLFLRKPRPAS